MSNPLVKRPDEPLDEFYRGRHLAPRIEAIAKALRQPDEWIRVDVAAEEAELAELEVVLLAKRLQVAIDARRRNLSIEVRFRPGG